MRFLKFAIVVFVLAAIAVGSAYAFYLTPRSNNPGTDYSDSSNGRGRAHGPCFDKQIPPPPPCPPCEEYRPPQCVCRKIPACKASEPL